MKKDGFQTTIEVKYRDTDSMGHVSSPVYYDYLQHAYLGYMFDVLQIPKTEKLPHIMVKTSCEYTQPAMYGDMLTVNSRVTRFGSKSFDMEHIMRRNDEAQTIVAKGASTHVMFDYASNSTTVVPEQFKQQVAAYQGE
ncbi:acyl-CoA thioesterase [Pseudoduganella violaceinigra]|uniref:acyl-CoA thioesterase n=1 Tax=Pseudoduganella violaceinigra TaxID=246602 RepID=UPI0004237D91|nr:acyl-CoA thioesterase [Pseudoduganella violaceinigra]